MGPTGSGKSTLLDALAGRKQGRLGAASRILVDGKPPGKDFHRLAGYCEQHESLLGPCVGGVLVWGGKGVMCRDSEAHDDQAVQTISHHMYTPTPISNQTTQKIGTLTVRETLQFSAELRLPSRALTPEAKRAIVEVGACLSLQRVG